MSQTAAPPAGEPVCSNIVLAGIGRDGASIIDRLEGLPDAVRKLFITGSPTQAISQSPALLRIRGDVDWRDDLKSALAGTQMLVLVATVIGREGSFTPEVIEIGRRQGALAVAVLVEPLLTGAPHRSDEVARVANEVIRAADATVVVPADAPSAGSLSINEAIQSWTERLTASVHGLLATAAAEDAMNIHMADVASTLSKHCRATVGVGEGQTVEEALRDAAKNSLAPPAELETARSVLAHVIGGGDMPLDQARRAGPALEHLFPKAEVCCGVSIREGARAIGATIIAGKLDVGSASPTEKRRTRHTELPFFKVGDPTVYDGEHLDIPAFVRKDVTLPGAPPRPVPAQTTLFDGLSRARVKG